MIQLPQYLLWMGTTLLAGYVAALGWRLGVARRFPFLTVYLLLSLCVELSRWAIVERWGFTPELYMNFYYGSDLLLAVALYLVMLELQRRLLPDQLWRLLHQCSLAVVGLWTVVSYAEIWTFDKQRLMLCAYELSSNLWFVSLGLILILWVIIRVRDLPRGIAAQMVQVWGIYFLLMASTYVLFHFFNTLPTSAPRLHLEMPVMAEVWLPLGLGFAILNKSQNGRSAANVPD
jgi:hypothetical protein